MIRAKHKTLLVLVTALLIDVWIGEPPNRWHPVFWMGTLITRLRKNAPQGSKVISFLYGGSVAFVGASLVGVMAHLVTRLVDKLPFPFNILVPAWLLKTTFSLRGLDRAAQEVESALQGENLPEARRLLSWHLVSRDTSQLDVPHVAAATIQSVAENTSDGIVAPLLWYAVAGLPGALIYRYINTGDSILGYRDQEREWLGKIPARMDDVLNLIPARVTALLFMALRPQAWRIWWRDASITDSPNAGHPMSAMAGALNVELEKIDHYTLNAGAPQPTVSHLRQSRQLMMGAVGLLVVLLAIALRRNDDSK